MKNYDYNILDEDGTLSPQVAPDLRELAKKHGRYNEKEWGFIRKLHAFVHLKTGKNVFHLLIKEEQYSATDCIYALAFDCGNLINQPDKNSITPLKLLCLQMHNTENQAKHLFINMFYILLAANVDILEVKQWKDENAKNAFKDVCKNLHAPSQDVHLIAALLIGADDKLYKTEKKYNCTRKSVAYKRFNRQMMFLRNCIESTPLTAEEIKDFDSMKYAANKITSSSRSKQTVLHSLAWKNYIELKPCSFRYLANRLIQAASNSITICNRNNKTHVTPLYLAIESRKYKRGVTLLTAEESDIDKESKLKGKSTFHLAISEPCCHKLVKKLLEYGANPLLQDCDGNTATMCFTTDSGIPSVVMNALKTLIDYEKAQFDEATGRLKGTSSLHIAVSSGKVEIARKLINAGMDINIPDKDGNTVIVLAMERNDAHLNNLLDITQEDIKDWEQKKISKIGSRRRYQRLGAEEDIKDWEQKKSKEDGIEKDKMIQAWVNMKDFSSACNFVSCLWKNSPVFDVIVISAIALPVLGFVLYHYIPMAYNFLTDGGIQYEINDTIVSKAVWVAIKSVCGVSR